MSWETTLYTGISFFKETYDSKWKVEEKLEDIREDINLYERRIGLFASMTEPKKFYSEEDEAIDKLQIDVYNTLSELKQLYIEEYKLKLLLECFDDAYDKEKNMFKKLPEGFDYNDSYIDGDFINIEKE